MFLSGSCILAKQSNAYDKAGKNNLCTSVVHLFAYSIGAFIAKWEKLNNE
jgi:hypothetical protein